MNDNRRRKREQRRRERTPMSNDMKYIYFGIFAALFGSMGMACAMAYEDVPLSEGDRQLVSFVFWAGAVTGGIGTGMVINWMLTTRYGKDPGASG